LKKEEKEKQEKENQARMEKYKELVQRLTFLSRFNVRQFMGSREEGDPRVEYLARLEEFKNLVNSQLSGIIRILTMMLGDRKPAFLNIMEEELANQLKVMEEELGVTGWTAEGQPQFDLQVLRERTKGWPQ